MPLYEYECTTCHRRTEKIQKFSDPELTVCPHCGGPLERTVTAAAFSFAGGGWYKDLYSSSAKPAGDGAPSDSTPAATGTDSATPAAAPAAPAAPASAPAATPAPATATSSAPKS